ncbi:MAG: hypothetical protein WBP90_08690 [Terracidiphilus sp.]
MSHAQKPDPLFHPQKSGVSDNFVAAVAYFSPIPAFFFLAIRHYNKRPYVRFHAWQSLVFSAFIFLFGVAMGFVVPYLRFMGARVLMVLFCVLSAVIFFIWLWCVIGAFRGKRCKLPLIGNWADEQAYR